jgi:hypothetical protein
VLCGVCACGSPQGTAPPEEGWANNAPTLVERVVDRGTTQLLEVSQGTIRTWVQVPSVGATVGDYVLLGQGRLRQEVSLPEVGETAREVVEIQHVRVVDGETARRIVRAHSPKDAVDIGVVFADLDQRKDRDIVVSGTVVKAPSAIGWYWVHLRDGTGDASSKTHDLTVKTKQPVTVGQRVAFRGTLRQDVDLGFGYHYEALIEDGVLVE